MNPTTVVARIEGKIHVETQYKFYIDADNKNKTRNQDVKLDETEENKLKYVEFHNKATSKPPISDRALEYFVLSIGKNPDKIVSQVWLLATDADSVLQEETFMNYILKDEATNKVFPNASSMMFISLTRLSQQKNLAGELASFLLGKLTTPQSEEVKRIASAFNTSFEVFKDDKEVKNIMSIADRWKAEAREEGANELLDAAMNKLSDFVNDGLSLKEAFDRLGQERKELVESVMQNPQYA